MDHAALAALAGMRRFRRAKTIRTRTGRGTFWALMALWAGLALPAVAQTDAIYVDPSGKVGIGTTSPLRTLDVTENNTSVLGQALIRQDGMGDASIDFFVGPAFWKLGIDNSDGDKFKISNDLATGDLGAATKFAIDASGKVGIGTATPDANLDIEANGPALRLTNTGGAANQWQILANSITGRLTFQADDSNPTFKVAPVAVENLLRLGVLASNVVDINGSLVINGTCSAGGGPDCDLVFQPDYPLESLEEHAAFMWDNSYLPGVGSTPEDARWDLGRKTAGILNELEKAHIYIEQLHTNLKASEAENAGLRERLARIEEVLGLGS